MTSLNEPSKPNVAELTLRSGNRISLTAKDIASAAEGMPVGDVSRQRVKVNSKLVDAVGVIALASGYIPDDFQSSRAFDVLRQLDFHLDDEKRQFGSRDRSATTGYVEKVELDESSDNDFLIITPSLAKKFRPYRGRWVAALNSGEVVADNETLEGLHADMDRAATNSSDRATVTIFYVPGQWRSDRDDP
jgi:hypothetical protein